jgi:hypothetical protein
LLVAIAASAGIFIYVGVYNVGADAPHMRFAYNLLHALHELRDRSIARYAANIGPPGGLNRAGASGVLRLKPD